MNKEKCEGPDSGDKRNLQLSSEEMGVFLHYFRTVGLEKTLEIPLDYKIKPVNPKGNQPFQEYSLEGLTLKLQYYGHLMRRVGSLEKTLMLGKIEGREGLTQNEMVG